MAAWVDWIMATLETRRGKRGGTVDARSAGSPNWGATGAKPPGRKNLRYPACILHAPWS